MGFLKGPKMTPPPPPAPPPSPPMIANASSNNAANAARTAAMSAAGQGFSGTIKTGTGGDKSTSTTGVSSLVK